MTTSNSATATASPTGTATTLPTVRTQPFPELVCAEIWGGNRPINAPIELPGMRGKIFSRPCDGGRGGDVHYLSICSSGLLSRLCLADVAGHGESVALVSGELHRLLRRYMNTLDERRVLADLNRSVMDSEYRTLTTAVAVSYFPPTSTLYVSYAGHPPGWLYRAREARWQRVEPPVSAHAGRRLMDMPLGVDVRTVFSRRKLHVQPGDRFVAVTDGVLEAPSATHELYGDARLEKLLAQHHSSSPADLVDAVVAALVAHTGDAGLSHDDVTLLAVEFSAGPRGFGVWEGLKNRVLGPRPRR